MDISSLNTTEAANEGAWMTVQDVNGDDFMQDGQPVRVKVAGADSEVVKQLDRRRQLEIINSRNRSNKVTEKDYDDNEAHAFNKAVASTLDWENVVLDGKPLECKKANIEQVYKLANVIPPQIINFQNDLANFTKKSSAT